jgi:hypothetical protein
MKRKVRHHAKDSAASLVTLAAQALATSNASAGPTGFHRERKSVFCIATRNQADQIVAGLKAAKISPDDISVVAPDLDAKRDFAQGKQTKATEGTIIGAGTGGALGWVAGLATMAILGYDPWIVGLSVGVLGAAVLGLAGGRVGRGIPHVKKAGILVAVHAKHPGELARAKAIFSKAGAQDGHARGEASVADGPPPAWARRVRSGHAPAETTVETAAAPPRDLKPPMPERMPRAQAGHLEPALATALPALPVDGQWVQPEGPQSWLFNEATPTPNATEPDESKRGPDLVEALRAVVSRQRELRGLTKQAC